MNDKHLRAWFVVFVIAVFLAGAGCGLLFDRYVGPPGRNGRPGAPFVGWGRGDGPPAMARRGLMNVLNPTPEQRTKLDAIFADRRKRIEQIQNENRTRFDTEQREMREEIEKILTPDQRKRFEEWLAREPMPGIRRPGRGMGPGRGGGMGPGAGGRGPGL